VHRADVVVTNNTGPMHIAAAVKTPVAVLFALTNQPSQWHPWRVPHRLLYQEVPCRICYSKACPTDHACLLAVSPRMVADAAGELLAEVGENGRKGEADKGRLVAEYGSSSPLLPLSSSAGQGGPR
jgi:ADP-heptose:LPS heptosyltransferase